MVKKAIVITVLLFAGYSVFLYFFQDRIHRTGQDQYSRNVVKAEEYLYEEGQEAKVVILGTSMGSRIVMDSLPGDYFNLAMAGMGIFDGLSLLEKASRKPEVVLIEMNVVLRGQNEDLRKDLFHPVFYPLKAHIPALRKKYQPVAVAKALLRDRSGSRQDVGLFVPPKHIFDQEVANVMRNSAKEPSQITLSQRFRKLSQQIQTLRDDNVQVVFFEMPFYAKAQNLREPTLIRQEFHKYFPAARFKYIDLPSDAYDTSDGIHLAPREATRYTLYLRKMLAQDISGL